METSLLPAPATRLLAVPQASEGNLIVFDGIDGAGKDLLMAKVVAWLAANAPDYPYWLTREPATARPKAPGLVPIERLFRFLEERAGHVPVIRKHQLVGQNVLADRFSPATLVYQHDVIEQYGLWSAVYAAQAPLVPDLVVLVTASPETAVKRLRARAGDPGRDFMATTEAAYLGQLQARYLEVLQRPGVCHDYTVVHNDGTLADLDAAAAAIGELLATRFTHRPPLS